MIDGELWMAGPQLIVALFDIGGGYAVAVHTDPVRLLSDSFKPDAKSLPGTAAVVGLRAMVDRFEWDTGLPVDEFFAPQVLLPQAFSSDLDEQWLIAAAHFVGQRYAWTYNLQEMRKAAAPARLAAFLGDPEKCARALGTFIEAADAAHAWDRWAAGEAIRTRLGDVINSRKGMGKG